LPADLAAVLGLVLLTALVVLLPVVRETHLRVIVSIPFLLFAPGYALVAALFPEAPKNEQETLPNRPLTGLERLVMSLGSSVALIPLIGFTLNFTPAGIGLIPMLIAISIFTVICIAIAAKRRLALEPNRRFCVSPSAWYRSLDRFLARKTQTDRVLNVVLILVLLFAMTSAGYAFIEQQRGKQYTELYLLTQDSNGDFVTDNYPTELTATQSQPLTVGVRNHEHERINYAIVAELQRVDSRGDPTNVLEAERLDSYSVMLAPNETDRQERTLTPTLVGDQLRVVFLLYRGQPPDDPRVDNAYRWVHLNVNVTAADR
jgi:uncharacterized membrane protein